ncbi:MAG TPA: S8 family serine peptidase [Burkholderiales bacterium]
MIASKRAVGFLACFGAAASIGYSSLTAGQAMPRQMVKARSVGSYVGDEVLVKFKSALTSQARINAVSGFGDRALHTNVGTRGLTLVKLPRGRSVEDAMNAYRAMTDVESVQPNYIYKKLLAPNDPSYAQLWGLHNTGQAVVGGDFPTSRVPAADIGAEQAWDMNGGDCGSAIVAVLDTGVNHTHADLAANMWDGSSAGFPNHGANFITGEVANDPMPADADGHGTHVAATIGAVGNNSVGTTGVCWKVQLMALRALTSSGGTTASVVAGLSFAVSHGAKVVNMSFGGAAFDPAFQSEIVNARDNGVVVVAAAGNDGTDNDDPATPQYPCDFSQDNVICVAALDQAYGLTAFSNFGAINVDVGAPGANVLSAWPGVTITDDFSTWTRSGAWSATSCGSGAPPVLVNPSNWCTVGSTYANGANDVAYRDFDLSGIAGSLNAVATFSTFHEIAAGDLYGFARRAGGGNPFSGGQTVFQVSGANALDVSENISACIGATCSLGFRLTSGGAGVDGGIAVGFFGINTTQPGSNVYQVLNGTSMATPHVSGVAAMIWAYNPNYTYADVVNSVKFGGDFIAALQGNTVSGRAVDAAGSLRFVNPPVGVTAVLSGP